MFKLNSKNALLLTLAGIIAGSLGVTGASAEKARIVNTGKNVDSLIHKIDIRNLSYFDTPYDSTNPSTMRNNSRCQTYKLKNQ